jgi:hypothetical protein
MTCSPGEHYVSIAGTVTDGESGDIIPGARVRITHAPVAFATDLMTLVADAVAPYPNLAKHYEHLLQIHRITSDSLKTAQIILDSLGRSQQFLGHRPDETMAGGDGHYCFFDLPPGEYGVTAAMSTLDHRYGLSYRSVQVKGAVDLLAFSQLDIEISLTHGLEEAGTLPIMAVDSTKAFRPTAVSQESPKLLELQTMTGNLEHWR